MIKNGVVVLTLYIIANSFTCLCAFVGFVYGFIKFFKPKKAGYAQMITLAVGSVAFGRLYQVVRLLTGGKIVDQFQLGMLGIIGSLLFIFSANFGLMDRIADDGSKRFLKYRLIPLAAPAVSLAFYIIFVFFADVSRFAKIAGAIITVFVMLASYYNLKHFIFPDVEYGIICCLKLYNLLSLLYSFFCITEMIAVSRGLEIITAIVGVIMGALLIAIVFSVERGIKKWTI